VTEPPVWISPGETATLIWYDAAADGGAGRRVYQIAGPLLEAAPRTPYFLLAPAEEAAFSGRLYRDEVTVPELRRFLGACTLARGHIDASMETLIAGPETAALPLLDRWRGALDRPLEPYVAEISAFLRDLPVYVSADAHAAARRAREAFARAWVCAECGDPEAMSVYLWTVRSGERVRVCLLIENEGGRWTCHFHPFDFEGDLDGAPEREAP
jgi:hypothetical protein